MILGVPWWAKGRIGLNGVWGRRLDKPGDRRRKVLSGSLLARAGVCRDFAHIGIAFCRALSIPARFVSCCLLPGAFGTSMRSSKRIWRAHGGSLMPRARPISTDWFRIGVRRDAAETSFASPFGEWKPVR